MTTTRIEEKSWEDYYHLGNKLYNQEKWGDAVAAFNQSLSLKPDNIDSLYMRGRIYVNLKQNNEAQADFDKIMQIDPMNHYAHYLYGLGLYTMQRYHESLIALNESLKLNPNYEFAFIYQGWSYIKLNQYDEANRVFKKAIELLHSYNAYYNYGSALYSMKQHKEALRILDKCEELDPTYHYTYYYKGYALLALGNKADAEKYFKKCIEVAPDNFNAWYQYAFGLSSLENYKECLHACEKTLELCPDYRSAVQLKKETEEKIKLANDKLLNSAKSGKIPQMEDALIAKMPIQVGAKPTDGQEKPISEGLKTIEISEEQKKLVISSNVDISLEKKMKAENHYNKKEFAKAIEVWEQDFKNNPYLDSGYFGYLGKGNLILDAASQVFGKSKLESVNHLNLPIYYKYLLKASTYYYQGNYVDAIHNYMAAFEALELETSKGPTTNINICFLKALAWDYMGHSYSGQYLRTPTPQIINEVKQAYLKAREIGKQAGQGYYGYLCYNTAKGYLAIAKHLKDNDKAQEANLLAEEAKTFAEEAIRSGETSCYYEALATYYANFTKNPQEKVESLRQYSLRCVQDENTKEVVNYFFDQLIKSIEEQQMLERQQKQIIDLEQKVEEKTKQLEALQQAFVEINSKVKTEQQFFEEHPLMQRQLLEELLEPLHLQLNELKREVTELRENPDEKLVLHKLFITAVKEKNLVAIDATILFGVEMTRLTKDGISALHICVDKDDTETATYLLKKCPALYMTVDKNHQIAIEILAQKQNDDLTFLEQLYTQGQECYPSNECQEQFNKVYEAATPNARTFLANKRFLESAKQGNLEGIKDALLKGTDINITSDADGETALHKATYHEYIDIVQYLIEQNANLNIKDNLDETPYQMAKSRKNEELIRIFANKMILDAISHEDINAIQSALSDGADVTSNKCLVLHTAIAQGNKDIVAYLLSQGANVQATDEIGEIPLHIAARFHNTNIIKLLLKYHAQNNVGIDKRSGNNHIAKLENNKTPIDLLRLRHEASPLADEMVMKFGGYKKEAKLLAKHSLIANKTVALEKSNEEERQSDIQNSLPSITKSM